MDNTPKKIEDEESSDNILREPDVIIKDRIDNLKYLLSYTEKKEEHISIANRHLAINLFNLCKKIESITSELLLTRNKELNRIHKINKLLGVKGEK